METIETFRYLMSRANDIYNNRIEKVLREMDSVMLYTLPTNEAWTLDRFLDEIKGTCKDAANDLHRSSVMVNRITENQREGSRRLIEIIFEQIVIEKN